MSRPLYALPAVVLALGLGAVRPAAAQPVQQGAPVAVPQRVIHPAQGRATGFDCAVEGLSLTAYPRRLMTFVDVAVRVRAVKGGFCAVRPDAVQAQTARLGSGVAGNRFASILVENGQTRWPGEVTEFRSAAERLEPWVADLKPGEVRTVNFRSVYEGDLPAKGEPELLARVRMQLASFGPRALPGAPIELRIVTQPDVPVRVLATAANANKQGTEPAPAGAPFVVRQAFDKDHLLPLVEWRYEGGGPAAPTAANAFASPLSLLEYLRFGLVRDVAAAVAAKDAKRLAAAFDEALGVTFAAARSEDPLVAGVGLRAFAWVANGLNATAWRVRAASEGGSDGAVVVPDAVAAELARVVPNFQRAIGNWEPPSPVGARSSRIVAAGLGDPLENKKLADEAVGRFVKRLDQAKAVRAPVLFQHYPIPAAPAAAQPLATSSLIEFRPSGPQIVSAFGKSSAPAGSTSRRVVRLLTHPRKAWKHLLVLAVLAGAASGLAVALRAARRPETSTV
ncbi:MAG TPA: hypothetical protein VFS43_09535 [Polyangiaceae bacterium]|nr:hypothetical protein [Polyangiaceae bacterium]